MNRKEFDAVLEKVRLVTDLARKRQYKTRKLSKEDPSYSDAFAWCLGFEAGAVMAAGFFEIGEQEAHLKKPVKKGHLEEVK